MRNDLCHVRSVTAAGLQHAVRELVRALGILADNRTPCGAALSPREAHALLLLLDHGRRGAVFTQAELQRTLGIDKSNVARLVQRLREDGRIVQERDPRDGRMRTLRLTAKGRKQALHLESSSDRLFSSIWEKLGPEDQRNIASCLGRLNEAIRSAVHENSEGNDAP